VDWINGDVVLADAMINNRGNFNSLSDNQMNGFDDESALPGEFNNF
jgi:hypothetical protein